MAIAPPRLAAPRWLRLPRRTARLRLTAVYSALFLLTGAALGAITYVLFERATEYSTPPIPKIPSAPASEILKLPRSNRSGRTCCKTSSSCHRQLHRPGIIRYRASGRRHQVRVSSRP